MRLEIKYVKHFDLIFHVLAHLKVNNASNCYSKEYIDEIRKAKQSYDYDVISVMDSLQEYYNNNFERVSMINFLPFYSNSFEEMKNIFINYKGFTAEDIQYFVIPFIEILNNESVFYFNYWNNLHKCNEIFRQSAEKELKSELEKYSCIFDYYNKSALAFLSYSITNNGRGFNGIESYFSALVPFLKDKDYIKYTFFTLLHEYTHQFTDSLLKTNINMSNGFHHISENVVILADYYLIKSIDNKDVPKYFKWLAQNSDQKDAEISEAEFLLIFEIDKGLDIDLKKLINNILER